MSTYRKKLLESEKIIKGAVLKQNQTFTLNMIPFLPTLANSDP